MSCHTVYLVFLKHPRSHLIGEPPSDAFLSSFPSNPQRSPLHATRSPYALVPSVQMKTVPLGPETNPEALQKFLPVNYGAQMVYKKIASNI